MKQKKVTIIISYNYEDKNTVSNDRIADRIKNDLLKGCNPPHEKIESVIVEDNKSLKMNEIVILKDQIESLESALVAKEETYKIRIDKLKEKALNAFLECEGYDEFEREINS